MSGGAHGPATPRHARLSPPPDEPPPLDGTLHPTMARAWAEICSRGDAQQAEVAEVLDADACGFLPGGGTRFESSRNWSGARVVPTGGHRFQFAAGRWRVPRLTPGSAPDPSGLDRRSSVWLGFGGHRSWSRALPQIGTFDIEGAPDRHLPFVQWWIRGNPRSGALVLRRPGIGPGDRILCLLWLRSPGVAAFYVLNADSRDPPVAGCIHSPDEAVPAAGVSAEWIVERPRDPATRTLHPLANFGIVELSDCAAGAAGVPERLAGTGRLHRMIARLEHPHRSRCIAEPRRGTDSHGSVAVRFR
ncbi:MAG: hypothetical protein IRZ13_10535 [Acetobacteraceae bacterium]|nr:hypothetical protein [Acetobacteraceae bacterium]